MATTLKEHLLSFAALAWRGARRLDRAVHAADPELDERDGRARFMRDAFKMLAFNGISGDYAEFGCHGGTTMALAFHEIRRHRRARTLWAFDSFRGLPEQQGPADYHPGWKPGKMTTTVADFITICRRNGLPDEAVRIVPGYYSETIAHAGPGEEGYPSDIALAYVDCDLHSSTVTVLEFLRPRLKHGMVIAFDDYFCFSDRNLSGERQAMLDVLEGDERFAFLPYGRFGWHGMAFVVEERPVAG